MTRLLKRDNLSLLSPSRRPRKARRRKRSQRRERLSLRKRKKRPLHKRNKHLQQQSQKMNSSKRFWQTSGLILGIGM